MNWGVEPPRAKSLAGTRVLVADDEAVIALELEYLLDRAGAKVVGPAFNVEEALELAADPDLSAAVLDVRLGRESVGPVARALAVAGVPFLFFSGQTESDDVRREWPGRAFIQKPAPSEALLEAVRRLVAPAGPQRDEQNPREAPAADSLK